MPAKRHRLGAEGRSLGSSCARAGGSQQSSGCPKPGRRQGEACAAAVARPRSVADSLRLSPALLQTAGRSAASRCLPGPGPGVQPNTSCSSCYSRLQPLI